MERINFRELFVKRMLELDVDIEDMPEEMVMNNYKFFLLGASQSVDLIRDEGMNVNLVDMQILDALVREAAENYREELIDALLDLFNEFKDGN